MHAPSTPETPSEGSGAMFAVGVGTIALILAAVFFFRSEPPPGKAPGTTPGTTSGTTGRTVPATTGTKTDPRTNAPAMVATRETCLAFLREQASAPTPRPGMPMMHPIVRVAALDALKALGDERHAALFEAALSGDGDAEDFGDAHIYAAVEALAAGRAEGRDVLDRFLAYEDFFDDTEVVTGASRAARFMEPEAAGRLLYRILAEDIDEFYDEELATILRNIAAIGGGAEKQRLLDLLANKEGTWDFEVRGAAAAALLVMGDHSGEETLAAILLEDSGFDGEEFAAGLAVPGRPAMLPWLRRCLAAEDSSTRAVACRSMGEVGAADACEDLRRALKDEDPDVRFEAGVALLRLKDAEGLESARAAATTSTDPELRALAWRVLGDHGDKGSRDAAQKILEAPWGKAHSASDDMLVRIWAARVFLL